MFALNLRTIGIGLGSLATVMGAALPDVHRRQADCQKPGMGLDPSCWQTLNLNDYVTKFTTGTQAACVASSGFAPCFLNSINMGTQNCNILNNNGCVAPSAAENLKPEDFYVAYAIYAINQAFNTYYNALSNANQLASETVPAIIQLLDPPQKANVLLTDVLTAISTGLSLVSGDNPIIGAIVQAASATDSILGLLFPTVSPTNPTGTAGQQMQELASIDLKLEQLTQTLQNNIDSAVALIMNDAKTFLTFASTGQFSQLPNASLFGDASGLLLSLNTYIVSQCLQANSIIVTRGPTGTDVNAFVQGGDAKNYKIDGCGNGYDQYGMCDAWYYDAAHQNSYALMGLTTWGNSMHDQMQKIIQTWNVTGSMLLANAADCADAGGAQKTGNLISAIPGGINSKCLSNPQVCTWNQDKGTDSTKIFSDCDNIGGWQNAQPACNVAEDSGTRVPYAYIGPLWSDSNGGCR